MSGEPSTSREGRGRQVPNTVEVHIESVTGQRWIEHMLLEENVADLKERIWRRTRLPPVKQALIFAGALLSYGSASLASVGIRAGATIKLVLLTRSGPVALEPAQPRTLQLQSRALLEHRRRAVAAANAAAAAAAADLQMSAGEEASSYQNQDADRRSTCSPTSLGRGSAATGSGRGGERSSAPEDTSAKESSENEEREEASGAEENGERRLSEALGGGCVRATARNKQRTMSQCTVVGGAATTAQQEAGKKEEENGSKHSATPAARAAATTSSLQQAILEQRLQLQQLQDENEPDGGEAVGGQSVSAREPDDLSLSEMSSGVIICDLSNEFRKIKVKRRHHTSTGPAGDRVGVGKLPPLSARRARSKPRATAAVSREATSSDEDEGGERSEGGPAAAAALPATARCDPAAAAASSRRAAQAAVRQPRHMNGRPMLARCTVCAIRLQSSFSCRCGKVLCMRHRGAHPCSKAAASSASGRSRAIAAQVSD